MSIYLPILNRLITAVNRRPYQRLLAATKQVEAAARRQLQQILTALAGSEFSQERGLVPHLSYEQLRTSLPVTTYADWAERIETQMRTGRPVLSPACTRYQPTSGSTAASKWIPYSQRLLSEFNAAAGAWLYDAAQQAPRLQSGRHYWSLSWLPDEQREAGKNTNDRDLLPWWKAAPMATVAAAPATVNAARTCDDALFATLAYLVSAGDLSLISVWSPTFALMLFDQLAQQRVELADALNTGSWGARAANLKEVRCPQAKRRSHVLRSWDGTVDRQFIRALWPQLAFVSAWDSASSKPWAQKLATLVAPAYFQGKGLWATEGVVTVPIAGQWPLALTSHFYEFRDLNTDQILPAWRLAVGMEVQPLLTTGSGLWRYQLQDRLAVTSRLNDCPSLTFLGRLSGTDLVGEKLESVQVQQLLEHLSATFQVTCLCLFAEQTAQSLPRYTLLAVGNRAVQSTLTEALEEALTINFHYRLSRQLGQLGSATAWVTPDAVAVYLAARKKLGYLPGDIKVEPLLAGTFERL